MRDPAYTSSTMNRLFATLVTLAWALWFGGMIVLFLAVVTIFQTLNPDKTAAGSAAAGRVAAALFRRFEVYQLGLAAAALVGTVAWSFFGARRVKTMLFVPLALATLGAVFVITRLTPPMLELREQGKAQSEEFDRLHKLSERVYAAQAAVLLIAGLMIPAAVRGDASPQRRADGPPESQR